MSDGHIFLCIVLAPTVIMVLGQIILRCWYARR